MRRSVLSIGRKLALVTLLVFLVSGVGLVFLQVTTARAHAASARTALAQALLLLEEEGALLNAETLEGVRKELALAEMETRALRSRLGPILPLAGYLGWLPFVGDEATVAPPLVELALALAQGGRIAVSALLPLSSLSSQGLEGLQDEAWLEEMEGQIVAARAGLAVAGRELGHARAALEALEGQTLPAGVRADLERLERLLPSLQIWIETAPVALDVGEGLVRAGLLGRSMERLTEAPGSVIDDERGWESLIHGVQETVTALQRAAEGLHATSEADLKPWLEAQGMERRDVAAVVELVGALARGGEAALKGMAPVREAFRREGFVFFRDEVFDSQLIEATAAASPAFGRARGAFEEVGHLLMALEEEGTLFQGNAFLESVERFLPKLEALATLGEVGGQLFPLLMGMDAARNFLVIPQNADELRATGGFIVGTWLISMDRGAMTHLKFVDNYDVDLRSTRQTDYFIPRKEMVLYQWAGIWIFLDANWLPDFPRSARMAEAMYRRGQGVGIDGVFALNQYAMRELVAALGPITIPGDLGEITGENFLGIMEAGTDDRGHLFMDDVVQELLRALGGDTRPSQVVDLLLRLDQVLREKQLLLYFNDVAAQRAMRARNWDGAIPEVPGDYLFVVDTNLGFDKANRNVEERLFYDVFLQADGTADAQLQIVYVNNSEGAGQTCYQQVGQVGVFYAEQIDSCYWDYLRIYVPQESRLTSATPMPFPETSLYWRLGPSLEEETTVKVARESGKTQIGGFFVVPRGETRAFTFRYKLPAGVVVAEGSAATYTLYLQKQSGTLGHPFTVRVHLPAGARMEEMTPAPLRVSGGVAEVIGRLEEDTVITVRFERP